MFFLKKMIIMILYLLSLQQLTGGEKQMAKAIAEPNKAAMKVAASKKHPSSSAPSASSSSSSSTFPSKRRSGRYERPMTCFSCHQAGHLVPQCPNVRPGSSSASTPCTSSTPKHGKKQGIKKTYNHFLFNVSRNFIFS